LDDEIFSIKEAAAYLKLSHTTIRQAIKEGRLPAAQLRGQWRIKKSDLDALFKKHQPEEPKQ
jgi:excisionase family DNA binding protein